MYKKINSKPKEVPQEIPQSQSKPQPHLYHAQHKAQFNIETNKNMSLNDMKNLSHTNFIENTNNIRNDYQTQHLNKDRNIKINLGFRG